MEFSDELIYSLVVEGNEFSPNSLPRRSHFAGLGCEGHNPYQNLITSYTFNSDQSDTRRFPFRHIRPTTEQRVSELQQKIERGKNIAN
jgi:hypothetical protein